MLSICIKNLYFLPHHIFGSGGLCIELRNLENSIIGIIIGADISRCTFILLARSAPLRSAASLWGNRFHRGRGMYTFSHFQLLKYGFYNRAQVN